jgi:triosephosphate isomerase
MPSRTPLIAANWKMNKTRAEAGAFLDEFLPRAAGLGAVELVVCPAFPALAVAVERCAGSEVTVAAQNMHFEDSGAFTGEVSAVMLNELGVGGVVLGHSERRQLFGETDAALARKLPMALESGLQPILCVGETEEQRDAGETEDVLRSQIEADLAGMEEDVRGIVVAYEPIWAIGTGRTATPEQAEEAIAFVRSVLAERDADGAALARILYGGSVKPDNAAELLGRAEIDGALVGGASLDPGDFTAICEAA